MSTIGLGHGLSVSSPPLGETPWFDEHLNRLGRDYYDNAGFAVILAAPCGLPSDQTAITPATLHAWIIEHTHPAMPTRSS